MNQRNGNREEQKTQSEDCHSEPVSIWRFTMTRKAWETFVSQSASLLIK